MTRKEILIKIASGKSELFLGDDKSWQDQYGDNWKQEKDAYVKLAQRMGIRARAKALEELEMVWGNDISGFVELV